MFALFRGNLLSFLQTLWLAATIFPTHSMLTGSLSFNCYCFCKASVLMPGAKVTLIYLELQYLAILSDNLIGLDRATVFY